MEQTPFSAETPIADIMAACPAATRLLLEHRAACPGCSMSAYCTLQEVCELYGIDMEIFLQKLTAAG
jgi:hybrid cluster-associated redox disulfide protein